MSTHDHAAGNPTRDPVCGMTVDPATAKGGSAIHAGNSYHFCSTGCREKFIANPQHYLDRHSRDERRGLGSCRARGCPGSRCHLHLPDASRDPPAGPRHLPDLRHGA